MRAYCRIERWQLASRLPGKRKPLFLAVKTNHSSSPAFVRLPISKWTTPDVFRCITEALSRTRPPAATSSIFSAMRSHPLNLLSIAKLNIAKSLTCLLVSNKDRIVAISSNLSGRFWPIILPLLHGVYPGWNAMRTHSKHNGLMLHSPWKSTENAPYRIPKPQFGGFMLTGLRHKSDVSYSIKAVIARDWAYTIDKDALVVSEEWILRKRFRGGTHSSQQSSGFL